jgi:hypothetical protein
VSEENVEIVRRAIASTTEPPDVETLHEVLDLNHVLTTDWGVDKPVHHGVQGYLAAVAEITAAWDSWQQEVERRSRRRGKWRGRPLASKRTRQGERRSGAVPLGNGRDLRGGRMATSRVFLDQGQALKAVGLEE